MSETDGALTARSYRLPKGYRLAECIRPDGTTEFWILDDRVQGSATVRLPDHEQTGKLPHDIAERCGLTCGAPTATHKGAPCRNRVSQPGERCTRHQDARPADGRQLSLPSTPEVCA